MKKITLLMVLVIIMSGMVSAQVSLLRGTSISHSNIEVTFLSQDPDPVEPGEYVNLRWRVENYGSREVEDVSFELVLEPPFYFDNEVQAIKTIGDIGVRQIGDESMVLHWRVRVDENALEGDHEVRLYYNTKNYGVKLDPHVIRIESRDVLVTVEGIEVIPERPKPGEEVEINVKIRNLAEAFIDEVKVKLDIDETSFATIGSSNEQVIKRISSGELRELKYSMIVDPEAESKVHLIPLKISYVDKFNEEYDFNSNFGLIVEHPPEYILNLEESQIHQAGQKGQIIISVSNIGTSDINFVTMEIMPSEDYEIISKSQMYLGNLESDDYETAEFDLFSSSRLKKNMDVKLKLTYKDSFNKNYEEEVVLPVKIYTRNEAIRYGLEKPTSYTGIIVLLAVIGIGGYWWYRRRKKKLEKAKNGN